MKSKLKNYLKIPERVQLDLFINDGNTPLDDDKEIDLCLEIYVAPFRKFTFEMCSLLREKLNYKGGIIQWLKNYLLNINRMAKSKRTRTFRKL